MNRMKSIFVFLLMFSSISAVEPNQEGIQTKEEVLIAHVSKSIDNALQGISQIDQRVLNIHGMSSPIIRHFLNNLCSLKDGRYLEIGCWKGSTLVSALYKNENNLSHAIAIDNWSEFGGPLHEFAANVRTFVPNSPLSFYAENCFLIDKALIFKEPINIYFYDGEHKESDQKAAFTYYDSVFDDVFIAVIDDWNSDNVRKGTQSAFQELGYQVLYERPFFTGWNGDTSSWWNGFYIAVVKKSTICKKSHGGLI
jgi:hypothetical protein